MPNILPMQVAEVPIGHVSTYPGNARKGDLPALRSSLEANGQYRPLVVQRSSGYVLAGNNTLAAALSLGWTKIAVQYVDVDDDRARRILLADNRTNDGAEYDDVALAKLLEGLVDDLEGTGYSDEDLDDILAVLEETSEETFFDAPPPRPSAPERGAPAPAHGEEGGTHANGKPRLSHRVDDNTSTYLNLNQLNERYEASNRRAVNLAYWGDDYIWVVEQLDALARRYGVDNSADTLAAMIHELTGSLRPSARTNEGAQA